MGVIVTLTIVAFIAIYFLNLQNKVGQASKLVDRNGPPVFNHLIYGEFDDALNKPMDVTKVGEFLYVTDTNNKRVEVFDSSGTQVFKFGKEGNNKGQFEFPYGIAADKKGNIYVADLYNGNISIFDSKGKFIKYFTEKDQKNKVIQAPAGLRIFNNKLYVTDIKQSQVFKFALDGTKLLTIGKGGEKVGELRAPNAVTLDKNNNIFVCDTGNQRIQKFSKKGKFIKVINGSDKENVGSVFVNPRGIGFDSRGILYVVDNMSHMVYGFDSKGKKLFTMGSMGSDNNQFYLPNGLYIDDNDQLYITDTLNQRIANYN